MAKQIKTYILGIVDFPGDDYWSVEGSFIQTLIWKELCNSDDKIPKQKTGLSWMAFY